MPKKRHIDLRKFGLLHGNHDISLGIIPMILSNRSYSRIIDLCRKIAPEAALLVPDLAALMAHPGKMGTLDEDYAVDSLAEFVSDSVRTLGLSLIPIVVLGYGVTAGLTAQFIYRYNALLGAGIIYRPAASTATRQPFKTLNGFPVFLALTSLQNRPGGGGYRLKNDLLDAGAHLICEPITEHFQDVNRDAALARIFIATLLG